MANENIGDIKCPFCQAAAHVRRYNARKPPKEGEGQQRGKFYIHCADCGPILASSKRVQDYILEKSKMYGADKPNDSAPETGRAVARDVSSTARAKTGAPPPAPARKKVNFDFDPYA